MLKRIYKQIPRLTNDTCPICQQLITQFRPVKVTFYNSTGSHTSVRTINLIVCSNCDIGFADKAIFNQYFSKRNTLRPIFFNPQKMNSASEVLKKILSDPVIFNRDLRDGRIISSSRDDEKTAKSKKRACVADNSKSNAKTKSIPPTITRNISVFISNTYNFNAGVCPVCCSVMTKDHANIPLLYENGDFYRYYAEEILYCHKCKKGYIGQKTIEKLLRRIHTATNCYSIAKLENARVSFNREQKFLYYPTADHTGAVFIPDYEHPPSTTEYDGEMNLHAQSFLGAMGYTVKLPEHSRRMILAKAVKIYGKRKVADLICFLISSRRNQFNGASKFANAIRIWQKDLNYITTL